MAEPGARVDFVALKKFASAHPETFDSAFQRQLTEVEKLVASGKYSQASKLSVQALDQQACRKSEGKNSFEIPQLQSESQFSALSLLESQSPEAVKRLASQQIERIREQFLDEVALRPAQERLEKAYLSSKPQPPTSAAELKRLHEEARQAILQPEALSGVAQDTPEQVKALKASRGDRLRLNDEALSRSLRDLPGKESTYQAALQKWKTRDRAILDQALQSLKNQGREVLFRKDAQARRDWETFKSEHPSLAVISNSLNELSQKASHDPKAALSLLQAQPVLRSIGAYARLWNEGMSQYPDQKKRSVEHADALRDLIRQVSLDAQNGRVHAITHYSAPKMADVLTGYDIDRLKNELSDDAWFAADAVGAAAVAIGTLGAGTPLLAASLSALGLLETGASIVHSAQRKNPDLPLSEQFQDPEIAMHAALFVATLPLESLSNLAKSERLALAAKRFYADPKKAEVFIQAAKKSATGFQVAKNGYFSLLSAESLARAALLCSNAEANACLQNFGVALLQAFPGGTDAYRMFHRKACSQGARVETAATCVPKTESPNSPERLSTDVKRISALVTLGSGAEDAAPSAPLRFIKANHEHSEGQRVLDQIMLQEFRTLNPMTFLSLKRLRDTRAKNIALGRAFPTPDEVRVARDLRDRLAPGPRPPRLDQATSNLVRWLESEYGLRSGLEQRWEPEYLLDEILRIEKRIHDVKQAEDFTLKAKLTADLQHTRKALGKVIEGQMKASGVAYEVLPANSYRILPTLGASPLNRLASRMKELHQVDLFYDPVGLQEALCEAGAQQNQIFVSHRSIQRGAADAAVGHEIRHALLSLEQSQGKSGTFGGVVGREDGKVPVLRDYSSKQYYPEYTQQEMVTFSYTLKQALTALQNPRSSPAEQIEARRKIYLSIHVLQNLAQSDRYVLSKMVNRIRAAAHQDLDGIFKLFEPDNPSHLVKLMVRVNDGKHHPKKGESVAPEDMLKFNQLVPFRPHFETIESLKTALRDARSANDFQSALVAESRLRGAQEKLKSAVLELLQERLEFARQIDAAVGSAARGVIEFNKKGTAVGAPFSPVTSQHSKPLPEALLKRILAPTVIIENRWKAERQ